ncbi:MULTISPECIES: EamA family transporter [Paenibacillus]|uniref:EamA family transporter n=1 Tax=Paenibacillus TaxID=44249 RepID=UPI0022B8B4ED|nr:EamA family transporter [Paenibacillus caseinilyticus]MCZ8517991.1 EamA family transporter [Paenibacillus caseinilyticus]
MWFVFAAASALCFGLRGILYQWSSQRPMDRSLMLLGVYFSGMLIALAASLLTSAPWSPAVGMGAALGLFSFISNAAMYKGYAVGKTSLVAMFTALPPVVVVLLAYLIWGEKLNGWQLLAFFIIIAGVLMIRYSNDISLKNLQGAQWGLIAMLFFGLTDLSTKGATLMGAATLPTLTLMYATGTVLFGLSWQAGRAGASAARAEAARGRSEMAAAGEGSAGAAPPAPPGAWTSRRTLLWGMAVGLTNISGMMLLMPAFRLGVTGLVSVVSAMNVVIVLLYARFGLREPFTRLEAAGLTAALAGIVVLRLAS